MSGPCGRQPLPHLSLRIVAGPRGRAPDERGSPDPGREGAGFAVADTGGGPSMPAASELPPRCPHAVSVSRSQTLDPTATRYRGDVVIAGNPTTRNGSTDRATTDLCWPDGYGGPVGRPAGVSQGGSRSKTVSGRGTGHVATIAIDQRWHVDRHPGGTGKSIGIGSSVQRKRKRSKV